MAQSRIAEATASATVGSSGAPLSMVAMTDVKTFFGSRAFISVGPNTFLANSSPNGSEKSLSGMA